MDNYMPSHGPLPAMHMRLPVSTAQLDVATVMVIDGPGGWWILAEPEVHFVHDIEVAVPDLAG